MIRHFTVPVSFLCVLSTAATGRDQQPSGVPDEIVAGWREYMAHVPHAEIVLESVADGTTTAKTGERREEPRQVLTAKTAFNGSNRRLEYTHDAFGTPTRRVFASNSRYAFRLDWGKDGWLLTEYAMAGTPKAKAIEDEIHIFYHAAYKLVSVAEDPLTAIAENLRVQAGNPRVLELAAPIASPNSPHKKVYQTLVVTLNEDRFHTAKSISGTYVLNNLSGSRASFTNTRESKLIGGQPFLTSEVLEESFSFPKGGGRTSEIHNTYKIDPSKARPESDFGLGAYGMPEPVGVQPLPKRTPNYVWLLVAAAVFCVVAVGLRFHARRADTLGANP